MMVYRFCGLIALSVAIYFGYRFCAYFWPPLGFAFLALIGLGFTKAALELIREGETKKP